MNNNSQTFCIQLSAECMVFQSVNLAGFSEQIRIELLHHSDVLDEIVTPYCDGIREEFSDGSVKIHEGCIELTDTNSGTVQIDFDGYQHFECRDMSGLVDHSEKVNFTIDSSGMLTLTPFYPDEREPDEF